MPEYSNHEIVVAAKEFLKAIDEKKITKYDKVDYHTLRHLTMNKITDFGIVSLIRGKLEKYDELLKKLDISYEKPKFIEAEKKEIEFKIKGHTIEAIVPFFVYSQEKRINRELTDLGFRFKRTEMPQKWVVHVKNPAIFDKIRNSPVFNEVGFTFPEKKKDIIAERLEKYEQRKEKLFELSSKESAKIKKIDGLNGELYPFQKVSVAYFNHRNTALLADDMGIGKMEWVDNKLFTPYGRKRIGDIQVGDKVIGSGGKPVNVIGVYPQGKKKLYRVSFNDGSSVLVGAEHLWVVSGRGDVRWKVLSTDQLLDKNLRIDVYGNGHNENKIYSFSTYYKENNGNNKWKIPIVKPMEFQPQKKLDIDPYVLGILLGDGSFRGNNIKLTSWDTFIVDEVSNNLPDNVIITKENTRKNHYQIISCDKFKKNEFNSLIKSLGLFKKYSYEKFIPEDYKYSTINNRISLLNGLLDSDGYAGSTGGVFYYTTSKQLAEDVGEIVNSLGGIFRILLKKSPTYVYNGEKRYGKHCYILNIKLPSEIIPFKLSRKINEYIVPTKYTISRYIKNIEFEREDEAVCIAVDAEDKLYATEYGILTHNTIQEFAIMEYKKAYPALIVCPAILRDNWQAELKTWLPHRKSFILKSINQKIEKADIYIISYDGVKSFGPGLDKVPFEFVALDEGHYIRNRNTKRTKAILKHLKRIPRRIILTGTPIVNSPDELIAQLDFLGVIDFFGGEYEFLNRYYPYDPESTSSYPERIAANEEELQLKLRETCMIRREKREVLKELPEKTRQVIYLSLSDYGKYRRIEYNLKEWYKHKGKKDYQFSKEEQELFAEYKIKTMDERAKALVRIGALKQLAAELKLKAVIEWIDGIVQSGESLVVFAYHREIVRKLAEYYGDEAYVLTSETSKNIKEMTEGFQAKKRRLFISSLKIGNQGLTLTAADKLAFVELGWHPAIHNQGEDRIYRIGQENHVNIYYLLGKGSIDEYIYDIIITKGESIEKATDMNKLLDKIAA